MAHMSTEIQHFLEKYEKEMERKKVLQNERYCTDKEIKETESNMEETINQLHLILEKQTKKNDMEECDLNQCKRKLSEVKKDNCNWIKVHP